MERRRGLTLVELLVVVAILALLVALLLPTLSRAREQAKIVACGSQLRQIGIAWQSYLVESNGTFPSYHNAQGRVRNIQWYYGGRHPSESNHGPSGVFMADERPLNPYLGAKIRNERRVRIFRCPSDGPIVPVVAGRSSPTQGRPTYQWHGNSYMANSHLFFDDDPSTGMIEFDRPQKVESVPGPPSAVLMAGDAQWYFASFGGLYDADFHRRGDAANVLYLDGHVTFEQDLAPDP